MKINEDTILALKKDGTNGLLTVTKVAVKQVLKKDLDALKNEFSPYGRDGQQILKRIEGHSKLKSLLHLWVYCIYLAAEDGGLEVDSKRIRDSIANPERTNSDIFKILYQRMVAAQLNMQINELCNAPEFLSHSHRYVGWNRRSYALSDNFSLMHRTNFGFGRSSHFYTMLTYKGVDIVPFSDWVLYRIVERAELVLYSAKHELNQESWIFAMEYACRAWNMMVMNETLFVERYIVQECEKMVDGVEKVMSKVVHFVIEGNNGFYDTTTRPRHIAMSGFTNELFQAEKVAGALTFISKIKTLAHIASVSNYISRIEKCNERMQEKIPKVKVALKRDIATKLREISVLEAQYQKQADREFSRKKLYEKFHQEMLLFGKVDYSTLDTRFYLKYPNYRNCREEFSSTANNLSGAREQLRESEEILAKLEIYAMEIKEYFSNANEDND